MTLIDGIATDNLQMAYHAIDLFVNVKARPRALVLQFSVGMPSGRASSRTVNTAPPSGSLR